MVRIGNVTNHLAIGDQRSRRVVEGASIGFTYVVRCVLGDSTGAGSKTVRSAS